jgi:hypothetical protein
MGMIVWGVSFIANVMGDENLEGKEEVTSSIGIKIMGVGAGVGDPSANPSIEERIGVNAKVEDPSANHIGDRNMEASAMAEKTIAKPTIEGEKKEKVKIAGRTAI